MFFRPPFSRRDSILLMLGALLTHFLNIIHPHSFSDTSIDINTPSIPLQTIHGDLPHTSIVHHAPGWTLFRNLYMSNGTLFFRLMISSGIHMVNTPENAALSEPTLQHMKYITPLEARKRWGGTKNRVWTVEGNTSILGHFYHLVAELFFGVQAFWHGAFSAVSAQEWEDRIAATSGLSVDRAWHFPLVLLSDRSASHRAWEYMREQSRLMGIKVGGWWEPIRASVLKFSGLDVVRRDGDDLPMPDKLELVERRKTRGWELNVMQAERMSKDAQVHAARTTILLGVHGNGRLTHLLFMPPTKVSLICTRLPLDNRALGMSHIAVWNDTYYTHPNEPDIDYPEGFQGDYIPVHGPTVARIIEDRLHKDYDRQIL
ncbi:uncharacterized protein EV420DRAFT_1623836 [Desarmillaria tabescens]|uniref:Glycosyltransferase family 61 protein n=1 Tax=Armillaria tabescens TaxID=1929756 RepID=A0AA39J4N1_ARMTA|nr:uncharacterized protein EV420DRAFT_1623836 [Desarmillaria tabescens]KAK0434263.1 hypothetical protein EV420DRAFT_1623836 [Desarmillaria tabescens]